ncbi:hypothetical protein Tco_0600597 [Tanacetum coccineum]
MDDYMFTTIKVVFRHEDTQLYGAILPDELTNEAIKDSESYKEYYVIASGAELPKTKASVKKKRVGSDMLKTPPTKGKRLKTSTKAAKTAKMKQPAKTSKAKGLTVLSEKSSKEEDDDEVAVNDDDDENDDDDNDNVDQDDDGQEYDEHDDEEQGDDDEQTDSDNNGDDFVHPKFSTQDEEDKKEDSFDPRVQTPSHVESTDDEDSDEEIQDANVEGDKMNEEETNEEAEVDALYKDMNVNLEGRDTEMTDAPCTIIQTTQVIEDTYVIITLVNPEGQQQSSSVSSVFVSNMLNPSPDIVKEQVKAKVSKILPKIKKTINEQLEAEVLTCSSNESKTSPAIAANLSELEMKKILIDKMESNKSIHKSNEQKNIYKALVDAYKSDKLIIDIYGDIFRLKGHRVDELRQSTLPRFRRTHIRSFIMEFLKIIPNEETYQHLIGFKNQANLLLMIMIEQEFLLMLMDLVQSWLGSLAQMEDQLDII